MSGIRSLKFCLFCLFLLCSASLALAQDSYQFEVSGSYFEEHGGYAKDADARTFSVNAYFNSIKLDGRYPHDEAAFWQRKSGAKLSWTQRKLRGMNQVRGGRILKSWDDEYGRLSLYLAHEEVPIWSALSAYYIDSSKLVFLGEGEDNTIRTEDRVTKLIALGVYPLENLSLSLSYYNDDDYKRYGWHLDYIAALSQGSFFGISLSSLLSREDSTDLDVRDGVVRNLDVTQTYYNDYSLALKFYPVANASVILSGRYRDSKVYKSQFLDYGIGIAYQFDIPIRVSLYLNRTKDPAANLLYEVVSAEEYSIGLAYRF